jgi:hypothetical protein
MSELIKNALKKARPNIAQTSLTTYTSLLTNLHKKVYGDDKEIDLDNFKKREKIIEVLKEMPINRCKTTLSGLVVLTGDNKYRELMLDEINKYNNEVSKQEKNDKQKENDIDKEDIAVEFKELKETATSLYKKRKLNIDDLQTIQQFIILSLMGGMFIPPRRSEYTKMKINKIDKDKDNYIQGNKLVFNTYKTSKFYGKQEITMPPALRNILKKWISVNPTDHLLFDNKYNPLTNVNLNQRINKIFGKKVGVNGLRHTYMSEKYAESIETDKAIAKDLEKMGSSASQKKVYIKED